MKPESDVQNREACLESWFQDLCQFLQPSVPTHASLDFSSVHFSKYLLDASFMPSPLLVAGGREENKCLWEGTFQNLQCLPCQTSRSSHAIFTYSFIRQIFFWYQVYDSLHGIYSLPLFPAKKLLEENLLSVLVKKPFKPKIICNYLNLKRLLSSLRRFQSQGAGREGLGGCEPSYASWQSMQSSAPLRE